MDNVVMLPLEERVVLIQETAERMSMAPSAVEKDFWVVWVGLFVLIQPAGQQDPV